MNATTSTMQHFRPPQLPYRTPSSWSQRKNTAIIPNQSLKFPALNQANATLVQLTAQRSSIATRTYIQTKLAATKLDHGQKNMWHKRVFLVVHVASCTLHVAWHVRRTQPRVIQTAAQTSSPARLCRRSVRRWRSIGLQCKRSRRASTWCGRHVWLVLGWFGHVGCIFVRPALRWLVRELAWWKIGASGHRLDQQDT